MSLTIWRAGAVVTIVLGLLAAVFVALAAVSHAAPYTTQTTVSVSNEHPAPGASITVGGTGYAPGEVVRLTIDGKFLGTAVADKSGTFSISVKLLGDLSGAQTILATGETSGKASLTALTIGSRPLVPSTGSGPSSNGGLATTGVAILGIGSAGLVLMLVGGAMLMTGRSRRSRVKG